MSALLYAAIKLVPPLRIELRILGYKASVMCPFNYGGAPMVGLEPTASRLTAVPQYQDGLIGL